MKVLLPIDFSEFSEAAIGEIERRPWPDNTTIAILHVVDVVNISSGWIDLSPYTEAQTAAANELIEKAAARLSDRGLEVSRYIVCGYPAAVVSEYAEKLKADLVVIGSHGLGALARFLLGSVARSALRATRCSVEVVRLPGRLEVGPPLKLLFATDGSECSEQAARSIAERPWPDGSIVKVLGVAEVPAAGFSPWNAAAGLIDTIREERIKSSHEAVNRVEQMMSKAGLKILTEVALGDAKVSIVDKAKEWGADLIAVGSHGRRGFNRLILGSVAEAVALHAHCSVEVIRLRDAAQ